MENKLFDAFASQRKVRNKRLSKIISRVEEKYAVSAEELEDDLLGLVSAAGEPNSKKLREENDGE